MNFDEYWNQGGASKLRERRSSGDVKEAAEKIWNTALKHGRTDNNFVNMSFAEYWNEEGIGDRIDEKNRWGLFFTIDKEGMKAAMSEIWNHAVRRGEVESITFDSSNTSFE